MSHRRILENNRQWVATTLRDDTNPTLGISGRVDAWVSGSELDLSEDDDELLAWGRSAAVTGTLTVAAYRI